MRHRVVAIIIQDGKILLLHRVKNGKEYYCLPGGGVEEQEMPEVAVSREIQEELNLNINNIKKLFEFENRGGLETYYLIDNFSGELKPFGDTDFNKGIRDSVEWCNKKNIEQINLVPLKAKLLILQQINFNV